MSSTTILLTVAIVLLASAPIEADVVEEHLSGETALSLSTAVTDFLARMKAAPMDGRTRQFAADLRNYDVSIRSDSQGYVIEFEIRGGIEEKLAPDGMKELLVLVGGGGRYVVNGEAILSRTFHR